MYSTSSGSFPTNGQPHYMDSFCLNNPMTSSQNESLMPPRASPTKTKKSKKKGCVCSCCKCELSSRSGHSLLAICVNLLIALIASACLVVVMSALINQKRVDEFVNVLPLYSLCLWSSVCILIVTILLALFGLYADMTEQKIPLKVSKNYIDLASMGNTVESG